MAKSDIKAGAAYVELLLRNATFVNGLKRSSAMLKSFGAGAQAIGLAVGAAGAAITGAFSIAAHTFASVGDELDDMSKRTGVSTEMLSKLGFAADQTGSDLGTVEKGLSGMAKFLRQVAEGGKEALKVLNELGVSTADLANKSPDERMQLLMTAISRVEDASKRAAIAMQVFGRSGTQLLPLIENFAELSHQATVFGLVVSTESASAASALSDAFSLMRKSLAAIRFAIGENIAPLLTELSAQISTVAAGVREFVQENKSLTVALLSAGVGLTAVGAVLGSLGLAAFNISKFISLVVVPAFSAMASAVGFLLSPLGLVIGISGTVVYWFTTMTETGRQMAASLSTWFGELGAIVTDAFGAIRNALAAGDIAAAAAVLWAGLKIVWLRGIEPLRRMWASLKEYYITTWVTVANALATSWSFMQQNWAKVVAGMKTIWTGFIFGAQAEWARMQAKSTDSFLKAFQMITGIDTSVERQANEAEKQKALGSITKEFNAGLDEARKTRDQAIAEAKQFEQQWKDEIKKKEKADREGNRDAVLRAGRASLDAKKAFEEALARANAAGAGPAGERGRAAQIAAAAGGMPGRSGEVFGTFSAAALAAQGGSVSDPGSDRIVRAIEKAEEKKEQRETRYWERLLAQGYLG